MTEENFKRLEEKLDSLLAKIDEINQKFEQAIVVAKHGNTFTPPKRKSKKEISDERMAYIKRQVELMSKARFLQHQFNLALPPHINRVEHYLRTNDPKAFDGLKRNK